MKTKYHLDPARAAVTLSWTVIANEDGDFVVEDIETVPASAGNFWKIDRFYSNTHIPPVAGKYGFQYLLGEGLRVLSMPKEVGEEGRQRLIEVFDAQLHSTTLGLSMLLQEMPTVEQIQRGAREIIQTGLQCLVERTPSETKDGVETILDMAAFEPGFVRVSASACAAHGDDDCSHELSVDPVSGISTVEFGNGRAFLQVNGLQVDVKVGSVDHSCPFALALNGELAKQVAQAVSALELESIREILQLNHRLTVSFMRILAQLAAVYKIELSPPD